MRSRDSLEHALCAFDPADGVPGLADRQAVPAPGHTPGHVAFFRDRDRVLISGDAVLTVNVSCAADLLRNKQRVSGPPRICSWDWSAARQSVAALARLEPAVLAAGHGRPMTGPATAARLRAFSGSWRPGSGRRRAPRSPPAP